MSGTGSRQTGKQTNFHLALSSFPIPVHCSYVQPLVRLLQLLLFKLIFQRQQLLLKLVKKTCDRGNQDTPSAATRSDSKSDKSRDEKSGQQWSLALYPHEKQYSFFIFVAKIYTCECGVCVCVSFPTILSGLPINEIEIRKSCSQGSRYTAFSCNGTTENLFWGPLFLSVRNIYNPKGLLRPPCFSHAHKSAPFAFAQGN